MTYTFDSDLVSDLHKDAYGFRPKALFWTNWHAASNAEKQAKWDQLIHSAKASAEADIALDQQSVAEFEKLVTETIQNGAKNRKVALEWLMQASGCNGDWEYMCYKHNLPYSYLDAKV